MVIRVVIGEDLTKSYDSDDIIQHLKLSIKNSALGGRNDAVGGSVYMHPGRASSVGVANVA